MKRQSARGRPASFRLLLSVRLSVLVVADLRAGGKGALAGQAGKGAGELRGEARGHGTVVAMKRMAGVREQGVCAFLVAQYLAAGLQAAMATQAGEHGEVGEGARGRSGGSGLLLVLPLSGRRALWVGRGAARLRGFG